MSDGAPIPWNLCVLRLYVTGRTLNSRCAIENLRDLCERELAGRYRLETIDVLVHPERAERDHILATPTLMKIRPAPARRIIGDLSERERVLTGLDIKTDYRRRG